MSTQAKKLSDTPADVVAAIAFSAVGLIWALCAAAFADDAPFRVHAYIFIAGFGVALAALIMGAADGRFRFRQDRYSDAVIRIGIYASLFWGVVGMLVGVIIACQLAWPTLFYFPQAGWLNFGRLRPVHTSGVIFAFGGNVLLATSFYVVQRTCRARLFGGIAPWFLFIVLAASGYVMGVTQGKEYSEPEWYIDLWLTIVWVLYLLVFLGTIWKRKEPHIYVANWFYLAFIVTIAVLHITNNLAIPIGPFSSKSYELYSGVQDALVQWWYGHNAVGFFLTAAFLAIMYYFMPKRIQRPIYSYRLSIVHFWALIFIYIWAGPHHLHYTALPQWAQTLGMTFSIMLWMPSWGGMINGLMTLSGAWDKLRTDPVVRMMVAALAFYGMSTFEGPVMSIREVNALSHYTDWTIGHVHSGALGWVGFISFGALYCMVPWLWKKKEMYSTKLIEWHFWVATIGILLYITSMWVSGIMEGLMWREYTPQGFLAHTFVETVAAKHVEYIVRMLGGLMYLSGVLIMIYNVWRTIRGDAVAEDQVTELSYPANASSAAAE